MRSWIIVFVALWAAACDRETSKPAPPAELERPLTNELKQAVDASTMALAAADAGSDAGAEDSAWVTFSRKDDVPLCVFATDTERLRALYLKDVKKQKLRPHTELTLGVFAPGCASEACIDRPTLQCWAELEGDVIVVHSRYSGKQHGERVCSTECESVIAGCPLPPLPAGSHRVRYGERMLSLKLPSAPHNPCLYLE